ncbi:MAG: hypothetical protein Q8Q50_03480 [Methylobacter sp.]|nr:hypothetical protein [Methylobacter sp.]
MRVIPPLEITAGRFTSSTIAEPDAGETAWNAATSYTVGDIAIRTTTHRKYQNLIAGVDATNPESAPTRWLDVGPTNKWAMFDTIRNSATIKATTVTVVLTPGVRVDAVALLGVVANSAVISMTSVTGGGTVYNSGTINLNTREVLDWYDYFFKAFSTQPSIALFDLPPYSDGIITITLNATSGNVECGACVIGSQFYLGGVQYEAENDVLNFSSVTRDFAGGTATMVQRRNVPKTIQSIWADKSRVNAIRDLRDSLNAMPAVWSGLYDDTDQYFEALLILGFYKKFSINLRYPQHAIISLELEEI